MAGKGGRLRMRRNAAAAASREGGALLMRERAPTLFLRCSSSNAPSAGCRPLRTAAAGGRAGRGRGGVSELGTSAPPATMQAPPGGQQRRRSVFASSPAHLVVPALELRHRRRVAVRAGRDLRRLGAAVVSGWRGGMQVRRRACRQPGRRAESQPRMQRQGSKKQAKQPCVTTPPSPASERP